MPERIRTQSYLEHHRAYLADRRRNGPRELANRPWHVKVANFTGTYSMQEWNKSCTFCNVILLQGETNGWCCNKGRKVLPRLPPYPAAITPIVGIPNISRLSLKFNKMVTFSVTGVDMGSWRHPEAPGPLATVILGGRTYHRMLPAERTGHPIHWLLYDAQERTVNAQQNQLPVREVEFITNALMKCNPFIAQFRQWHQEAGNGISLEIVGNSNTGDVASLWRLNGERTEPRSIFIHRLNEEKPTTISILSNLYEPFAYPLFWPSGGLGWSEDRLFNGVKFSQIDYYKQIILREPRFAVLGRLMCEYICDMYSRCEDERLAFIRLNRRDPEPEQGLEPEEYWDNRFLPRTFHGSLAWSSEMVARCHALARARGQGTFFITMTCSVDWPEIRAALHPNQGPEDRADVIMRVWHIKLAKFVARLKKLFPGYMIKVIEFQLRGIPHAHIILCCKPELPFCSIDNCVSAEMPRSGPNLEYRRHLVGKFMTHTHTKRCGWPNPCLYQYPKDIQPETRMTSEGKIIYRRRLDEDAMIVPHHTGLLEEFMCHINVEVCWGPDSFGYLFKYFWKQSLTTHARLINSTEEPVNEENNYLTFRYMCATDAINRIFRFQMCSMQPSVTILPVHLKGSNTASYSNGASTGSLLLRWLKMRPRSMEHVSYKSYYEEFTVGTSLNGEMELCCGNIPRRHIVKRTKGRKITHLSSVMPQRGEVYYLRTILDENVAVRTWTGLRTVNGFIYATYQAAAVAMGLFDDAVEAQRTLKEACELFRTPAQLRFMFTQLILDGVAPAAPLLEEFKIAMRADFDHQHPQDSSRAHRCLLIEIDKMLRDHSRTMEDLGLETIEYLGERLQEDIDFWNPRLHDLAQSSAAAQENLNNEQQQVLRSFQASIQLAVDEGESPIHFLEGKAGTGKTFLLTLLSSLERVLMRRVVVVGTSGLAAAAYVRATTAHYQFKIPITKPLTTNYLTNTMFKDKDFWREVTLIIWDELPMVHKDTWEYVDTVLRLLRNNSKPFGGIAFIGCGDWKQVGPVVRGGGKHDVIDASVKTSTLWSQVVVSRLTVSIRQAGDPQYEHWIDSIGEGLHHTVNLERLRCVFSVSEAFRFLYPNGEFVDPAQSQSLVYLTVLNQDARVFNAYVLDQIQGESRTYYSSNVIKEQNVHDGRNLPLDNYLNHIETSGVPLHQLKLKVGAICALMQNISCKDGLVKNGKVVVLSLNPRHVIIRTIPKDGSPSKDFALTKRTFEFRQNERAGYSILRRQLPLKLAYANTFNGCQSQTLERIVVDIRYPVFTHGQLYTAMSRVRLQSDIVLRRNLDHPIEAQNTTNIVFRELLD